MAAAATDPNVLPPASGAPGTASELGRPISIGYTPPPDVFGVLPDFAIEPSYNFAPLTIELPAPATAPLATLDQAQLDWGEAAGSLQPTPPARLRAQSRDGELREFEFRSPAEEAADTVDEAEEAGAAATEADTEDGRTELERLIEDPPRVPEPAPLPDATVEPADAIEISADRQQFNERQRIVTAQGEVVVRLAKGILTADRVRVNLPNRYLVAEGDVALRRGEQVCGAIASSIRLFKTRASSSMRAARSTNAALTSILRRCWRMTQQQIRFYHATAERSRPRRSAGRPDPGRRLPTHPRRAVSSIQPRRHPR
ncbi:MAG: hypothetical protein HC838_06300 [Spirulinaceae cyanobacterium RM2_2_10]|nr:hypothetical protein [Spirulinaceae cyanobacterium RM2_2_10]